MSISGIPWLYSAICYGWLVLLIAGIWWFTRRLPLEQHPVSEPAWATRSVFFHLTFLDGVSLTILAILTLVLWFSRGQFIPRPPDGYYHITVVREILKMGHIPLWSTWELAPYGRPHLYPPGFHILMAALSIPSGDALQGFRAVSALLPPIALGSVWYLARWLFDERRGFVALLIAGMDIPFMVMGLLGVPVILAGAVLSFMLICFLSKKPVASALFAALSMYIHMGMAPFAFAGLFLFSLQKRDYLPHFFSVSGLTLVMIAPWYTHVWTYHEWLGHPIDRGLWGNFTPWKIVYLKLIWMLVFNIGLFIIFILRATRVIRWNETRNRLLLCQVLAYIPVWISYGGRYFAQTLPFWAIFTASVFTPLLKKPLHVRHVMAALLLALCPTAAIVTGFGGLVPNSIYPIPSGWMLPPVVAVAGQAILDASCEAKWDDLVELGTYIQQHTRPNQIIYCLDIQSRQLAAMVGYHADRPIATAVWEEVWPDPNIEQMLEHNHQQDTEGIFIRRARRFSRGVNAEKYGYTPNTWVEIAGFQVRLP